MALIDDLRTICPPQNERELSHPDQLWRASLLHKCPRIQLLQAKGVYLRPKEWLQRKFSLHAGSHDNVAMWIRDRFSANHDVLLEECIYDANTRAGGHVDTIIVDGDVAYMVEIKTYLNVPKEIDPKSYWVTQVSFYFGTIVEQQRWKRVIPLVMITGFLGEVRVIEPKVTEEYKDILGLLNLAWEGDMLPPYMDCYLQFDCKKCPVQQVCTEPITSVKEFAEEVKRNANDNGI